MYIVFNFFRFLSFIKFDKGDVTITINGSSITFLKTGDILVQAKRHMIIERDLMFDNCPREMIQQYILMRELGEEVYNEFVEQKEQEYDRELGNSQLCSGNRSGKTR